MLRTLDILVNNAFALTYKTPKGLIKLCPPPSSIPPTFADIEQKVGIIGLFSLNSLHITIKKYLLTKVSLFHAFPERFSRLKDTSAIPGLHKLYT